MLRFPDPRTVNLHPRHYIRSAGGVQLAIYNKTEQARATDKLDYWESVWKRRDSFGESDPDNYNPDQDVWRVELRYHHSIIQQFASGSLDLKTDEAIDTRSCAAFSGHLDGLWRYGLGQSKLRVRPGYFAPIWTMIRDDVRADLPVDSLLDDTGTNATTRRLAASSAKRRAIPGKLRQPTSTGAGGRKKGF